MEHPSENRTARFELVMRPSDKAALARLADAKGVSIAHEMRAAVTNWLVLHQDGFSFYEYDES